MISAGQTQNVGSTLDRITSLACANEQTEDKITQCVQDTTNTYTLNLQRVPENLKAIFEGFAYVIANTIFKTCPTAESNEMCSSNGGINLWGGTYTFASFLLELANRLSGQNVATQLPPCSVDDIRAGLAGTECQAHYECVPTPSDTVLCSRPDVQDYAACIQDRCSHREMNEQPPSTSNCQPTATEITQCQGDIECARQRAAERCSSEGGPTTTPPPPPPSPPPAADAGTGRGFQVPWTAGQGAQGQH